MIQTIENFMPELTLRVRDHVQGPQSAEVTLVEYGDYTCDRCGQMHAFVQDARQQLGYRLRFIYRHFVPPHDHPHAQQAAEAAEAAGAQGHFWEMHHLLFTHQEQLDNGFLVEYAATLGLDINGFLRDMAGHVYGDRVNEDRASGVRNGVSETPAFFINGLRYDRSCDNRTLREALEAAAS